MNEEIIKELVNESLLKTSVDFTDSIMKKIGRQRTVFKLPRRSGILMGISIILIFSIPILWNYFTNRNTSVLLPSLFILLVFILINMCIKLKEVQRMISNMPTLVEPMNKIGTKFL